MDVTIVPFAERFTAYFALVGTNLLVHLLHMLGEVGALREFFPTALVLALERPILGVRAHMVHEFGGIGDNAVATVALTILALVDLEAAVVGLEALELEDDKGVGRRNVLVKISDGGKIETVACHGSHCPILRHLSDFLQLPK